MRKEKHLTLYSPSFFGKKILTFAKVYLKGSRMNVSSSEMTTSNDLNVFYYHLDHCSLYTPHSQAVTINYRV